jgi:hypothetical protein
MPDLLVKKQAGGEYELPAHALAIQLGGFRVRRPRDVMYVPAKPLPPKVAAFTTYIREHAPRLL